MNFLSSGLLTKSDASRKAKTGKATSEDGNRGCESFGDFACQKICKEKNFVIIFFDKFSRKLLEISTTESAKGFSLILPYNEKLASELSEQETFEYQVEMQMEDSSNVQFGDIKFTNVLYQYANSLIAVIEEALSSLDKSIQGETAEENIVDRMVYLRELLEKRDDIDNSYIVKGEIQFLLSFSNKPANVPQAEKKHGDSFWVLRPTSLTEESDVVKKSWSYFSKDNLAIELGVEKIKSIEDNSQYTTNYYLDIALSVGDISQLLEFFNNSPNKIGKITQVYKGEVMGSCIIREIPLDNFDQSLQHIISIINSIDALKAPKSKFTINFDEQQVKISNMRPTKEIVLFLKDALLGEAKKLLEIDPSPVNSCQVVLK